MKQKDIALITVIIFISAIASLLISKTLFGGEQSHSQQAEVVQPITAEFPKPDTHYFNDKAFDPTKRITVGPNANPDPFSATSQ
jgi:hypothetical protein